MKKSLIYTLFIFVLGLQAQAQNDKEYLSILNDISSNLKVVQTSESEWKQSLRASGSRPYVILMTIDGVDKKGKATKNIYEINLTDLDPNTLKYEARKDEMQVKAKALKGQSFIKKTENDQTSKYVGEVVLYADNTDNARTLVEALRKAIPAAQKIMQQSMKVNPNLNAFKDWLLVNVASIKYGEESYRQSLTYLDAQQPRVKFIQQKMEKGKTTEDVFELNLGDCDEKNITLSTKDPWAYLEIQTKNKLNYIRHIANGKLIKNDNSIRFYFDNIEKAREGKLWLEKNLPLTAQQQLNALPSFQGLSQALSFFKNAVKNSEGLTQSLNAECQTVLQAKEGNNTLEYRFFWGDFNEKSSKITTSGSRFEFSIETANRLKYIEVWKNGEKQNYTSSLQFTAEDIETLRPLPNIVEPMIAACRDQRKLNLPQGTYETKLSFINSKLGTIQSKNEEITQKIENTSACSAAFSQETKESKKSISVKHEFSFSDIDPTSVELQVSGSQISIQVSTSNKEKAIKSFKNETPSDYLNGFKILANDLVTGLTLRDTFKAIVIGCKK